MQSNYKEPASENQRLGVYINADDARMLAELQRFDGDAAASAIIRKAIRFLHAATITTPEGKESA